MKKIVTLLAACTLIILLAGCGNSNASKANDTNDDEKPTFKLMYTDDDVYDDGVRFETNKNGDCTIKIKGLKNGTVKLETDSASADDENFKTKHIKLQKGKVIKEKIHLKDTDFVHDFELSDKNDNTKDFSVYNNSAAANSSISSMDSSESSESKADDTNSNFEKATKFESQLNTSIKKSRGAISDVKCDIDPTTGEIKSVTFVVDDSILDAPDSDIQKVKSEADSAVSTVANKYNLSSTPKTYIKTQSGESVE